MRSKVVSIDVAARMVRSGDVVIMMGGMEFTPMALLREVVRAEIKELNTVGV
ncbi:MAG: hypothetical protein IIB11_02790, partial [Chloroflexi bacterium]|nr:hypothetical protein [Chloroflexota bacterium]